jgi:hypothetical protein
VSAGPENRVRRRRSKQRVEARLRRQSRGKVTVAPFRERIHTISATRLHRDTVFERAAIVIILR